MVVFMDQWVRMGGHAKFSLKFIFNRKRNTVELEINQGLTIDFISYKLIQTYDIYQYFKSAVRTESISLVKREFKDKKGFWQKVDGIALLNTIYI